VVAVNPHHERHLQATLEQELRLRGWRYYHTASSQRSVAGFPDIVAIRGERVLVAEIKGPRTRVTREQAEWLAAFETAGVPAFLWRFPAAWGEVGRVLR
jgi:Holliday junction resolvase